MENRTLQQSTNKKILSSQSHKTDVNLSSSTDVNSKQLSVLGPTKQLSGDSLEEAPVKHIISLFQLPNGTVGKYYSALFHTERIGQHEIEAYEFDNLEPIGLSFNKDTNTIEGTPIRDGEHTVLCRYRFQDINKNRPFLEKKFNLTINPNPRTLWKNLPSDKNDQYWKEDTAHEGIFKERSVIAASRRGRAHAHEGKFRDDDYKIFYAEEEGWYIATVSDGAGSAKYSRKGSEIACNTTVQKVNELIRKECGYEFEKLLSEYSKDGHDSVRRKVIGDTLYKVIGSSIFEAYKVIRKESKEQRCEVKDFATTLILGICKHFDFGWFIASFWVGDGCISIYRQSTKEIKILGVPDTGKFAGETRFITMSDIWEANTLYQRLRFEIVDDFTAIVLMTDGITDPMFQTDNNLMKVEKWDELWKIISTKVNFSDSNKEADKQLLEWMDFWSVGNHDDRTMVIIY